MAKFKAKNTLPIHAGYAMIIFGCYTMLICRRVGMADEADSKSVVGDYVRVQVPPPAVISICGFVHDKKKLAGISASSILLLHTSYMILVRFYFLPKLVIKSVAIFPKITISFQIVIGRQVRERDF